MVVTAANTTASPGGWGGCTRRPEGGALHGGMGVRRRRRLGETGWSTDWTVGGKGRLRVSRGGRAGGKRTEGGREEGRCLHD